MRKVGNSMIWFRGSTTCFMDSATANVTTVGMSSIVIEGEVSFAGQVNDRLGKLFGYGGEAADRLDVENALPTICIFVC